MDREFAGKGVLVTGSTSGIGRACALRFAAAGAQVAAVGRNKETLKAVCEEIENAGGTPLGIAADLCAEEQVDVAVSRALDAFGGVDVLVNAAGHVSTGTIEDTSKKAWDAMMDIDVRAVFTLPQKVLPNLIPRKGNIVNVSSVTGLRAFPRILAYCVSKAALDQMTRCAALELAAKGVRVNAVNPGVVVTEIHKRSGMNEDDYAAFLERSKQTHPLGRVGQASEVAELVFFLASDKAGWITGSTYSIDGWRGQTCAR